MDVLKSFPRGTSSKRSAGPSAAFATIEMARDPALAFSPGNQDGRFFLGIIGAEIEQMLSSESIGGRPTCFATGGDLIGVSDDRHIVTIAGSRAGKGRCAIVPNLLTYPGSMLVIDPKGDLARLTAGRRAQMGHQVHVLDPFDVSGVARKYPGTFNPLRLLQVNSPTLVEDAGMIADSLVVKEKEEKDPH
jgi:type IV secretion system protein VirD4